MTTLQQSWLGLKHRKGCSEYKSQRRTMERIARPRYLVRLALCCALSATGILALAAQDTSNDATPAKHSSVEIVTSALGLERIKNYSANENAVGFGFAKHFGIETSYVGLGQSKFAQKKEADTRSAKDIGGRADVKLAFDIAAPLNSHARLYSRVGMYFWDLDVNYSLKTNKFYASQNGSSDLLGLGAAYGTDRMRFSTELERVNSVTSDTGARDLHRLVFIISSSF